MRKIVIAASFAALAIAPVVAQSQAGGADAGELWLHQMVDYDGEYYAIDSNRSTTVRTDWTIRSISIHEGETWEICAMPRYRECIQLMQSVPDASRIGLEGNQIGSARRITGS